MRILIIIISILIAFPVIAQRDKQLGADNLNYYFPRLKITSLATGGTAPTTSGTTKIVICDQNGLLSNMSLNSSQNISNTALTWNGSYPQNVAHFPLTFSDINTWSFEGKETNTTIGATKIRHRFYSNNSFTEAMNLFTSIRNIADNSDSLLFGFRNYFSGAEHFTGLVNLKTSTSEQGDVVVGLRTASINTSRSGKSSSVAALDGEAKISATDSITIKGAIVSAQVDSNLAGVRNEDGEIKLLFVPAVKVLKGSTTWDPASVGGNSSTSTTLTVTGAALGDGVTISKTSGSYSNGELYFAYVSATNTVTIQLQNVSGGSFDIASATFNVIVLKH